MSTTTLSDPRYDVFETEVVDRNTSTSWELIKTPLESLDNNTGDIRFRAEASAVDWLDLNNAELTFEARIVKKGGALLQATDSTTGSGASAVTVPKDCCMLVNNSAHAVFKDVRIRMNETTIAGGDGNYPFIAMMANQYQFSHAAKATFKADEGYYSPEYDAATGKEFDDFDHPINKALVKAYDGSKWVSLHLPLNAIPIFNQEKAIPPARQFEMELVRNDPGFCIWAKKKTPAESYDYQLRNMKLHIPMLRPSLPLQRTLGARLVHEKIDYPYVDLGLYRRTVMRGTTLYEGYNVFFHKEVKLAFIALIPANVYNDQNKRKFIFKRHHLQSIDLRAEGRSIAGEELSAKNISTAYHQMNRALGLNKRNEDIGITRDDFDRYANVYVFDCTPGKQYDQRQDTHAREYGLILKFETALTENYDVLCFYTEDKRFNFQPGNLVVPNDYAEAK